MMSTSAPSHLSELEERRLELILDHLEKNAQRSEMVFAKKRQHDRRAYRGQIWIAERSDGSTSHPVETDISLLHQGWSYSLSQSGIGFICLERFMSPQVSIGIQLPNGQIRWMIGHIVRQRSVPEERFYEYGVAFGQAPPSA